jgi:hypothetical protein
MRAESFFCVWRELRDAWKFLVSGFLVTFLKFWSIPRPLKRTIPQENLIFQPKVTINSLQPNPRTSHNLNHNSNSKNSQRIKKEQLLLLKLRKLKRLLMFKVSQWLSGGWIVLLSFPRLDERCVGGVLGI